MNFHRLSYKLKEGMLYSPRLRVLLACGERVRHFQELKCLKVFLKGASGKSIVGLSGSQPYQFEHIKELFRAFQDSAKFFPLVVGPTFSSAKRAFFENFKDSYKLENNKNFFSYIWLPVARPKVFIEPVITTYSDLCPNAIKLLYAHGLAMLGFSKDFSHIRHASKYDYLLLTGPLQKRAVMLAHDRFGGRLPELVEIGFLHGDSLMMRKRAFDRGAFLKSLGLKDQLTVMFAPTWGEFSAVKEWIDPIAKISHSLGANLLLRLHPLMLSGSRSHATGGVDWKQKLAALSQKYDNIRVVIDDDIEEIMLGSDVMITDVSSVGPEYMLLEKPVIFLPAPAFFKIYGYDGPIAWVREGLEVRDVDELKEKLATIRSEQSRFSRKASDIVYNPGRALETMMNFINKVVV